MTLKTFCFFGLISLALLIPPQQCGGSKTKQSVQQPTVGLTVSHNIQLGCPVDETSQECTPTSQVVELTAVVRDFKTRELLYTYSVTGGRITGEGSKVSWDLAGSQPGTYTATVEVEDNRRQRATTSTTVTVSTCACLPLPCPSISVSCPADATAGSSISFSASADGTPLTVTYLWSVSAGTIIAGQGTSSITVDSTGLVGQSITATITVGMLAPSCGRTASCSTGVK